ncbi:MAG: transmembrane 220 family protein [Bacteroidota bacterium]
MRKKIIDGMLAVLFLLFAVVQFNDPDPLLWIAIYGIVALVSIGAFFNKYHHYTLISLILIITVWSLILVPNVFAWLTSSDLSQIAGEMMDDVPHIEGTREFGGLVIADIALIYHWLTSKH